VIHRDAGIADWPHMLVLCKRCTKAAETNEDTSPDDLLLPHRDLTFALASDSPLQYTRDGDTGHVTVAATTAEAASTVGYFALNGFFPEEAAFVPASAEEEARAQLVDYIDPRPRLRDEVWNQASHFAGRLRDSSGRDREERLGIVHLVAASSGFWSLWATVLWNELEDRDALETVLQPPAPPEDLTAGGHGDDAPPPENHAFASTRPDWLPPVEP
jgi:hypothetical protein